MQSITTNTQNVFLYSPNAGTQASAPLVDGIVNHVLLQSALNLHAQRRCAK